MEAEMQEPRTLFASLDGKQGFLYCLIDVAKGWLAAMLPVFFNLAEHGSALLTNMQIIAGIIAIVGHIFPVFAGFRGGKGVASIFGVFLALHPLLTVYCTAVFLAILLITGIVSLASMSAGIAFPLFLFLLFNTPSVMFKVFSIIVGIALIVTHRKNIGRLLRGEETRLIRLKKIVISCHKLRQSSSHLLREVFSRKSRWNCYKAQRHKDHHESLSYN